MYIIDDYCVGMMCQFITVMFMNLLFKFIMIIYKSAIIIWTALFTAFEYLTLFSKLRTYRNILKYTIFSHTIYDIRY